MKQFKLKWLLVGLFSTALLAACGGDNDDDAVADGGTPGTPGTPQTITAVPDYLTRLIEQTPENGDLVDVSLVTLSENDRDEPTAFN